MATLPFPKAYLHAALMDEHKAGDAVLRHLAIGKLALPSGKLVACDPLVNPDTKPFNLSLAAGEYPVVLSLAHSGDDQAVAFAMVRLSSAEPVEWQMLTAADQEIARVRPREIFGYPVDAGMGCFMDQQAAVALDCKMREDAEYSDVLIEEMEKTEDAGSWINVPMGPANLVAFSSGYGDGVYATYAGLDGQGNTCMIVTDFAIVDPDNF